MSDIYGPCSFAILVPVFFSMVLGVAALALIIIGIGLIFITISRASRIERKVRN